MDWIGFNSIPDGTEVFNHGYSQCVALANLYHESVMGGRFVPVDAAVQWWSDFDKRPELTSKYTKSSTPVAGSIFVSFGGIYDGVYGHIGVVVRVEPNGSFIAMEQNTGSSWPKRYVYRYNRGFGNVLGFLIPKVNPAAPKKKPAEKAVAHRRKNKEEEMLYVYLVDGVRKGEASYALMRLGEMGSWFEFSGQESANQLATQYGSAMRVWPGVWTDLKARHKERE